jgi:hypothetical protein
MPRLRERDLQALIEHGSTAQLSDVERLTAAPEVP